MSVCHTKGVLQPLVRKRTIRLETDRNHPGYAGSIQVITVDTACVSRIQNLFIIERLK